MKCRVNEVEIQMAEARARQEGLGLSEYIRREVCGVTVEAPRKPRRVVVAEPEGFEDLVERYARTMPRRNAEFLARRRLQGC